MEFTQKLIRSSTHYPKLYTKYKNPSSSGSLDIMLTSFFIAIQSPKRGMTQYFMEFAQKLIHTDPKLYAKYQNPTQGYL